MRFDGEHMSKCARTFFLKDNFLIFSLKTSSWALADRRMMDTLHQFDITIF